MRIRIACTAGLALLLVSTAAAQTGQFRTSYNAPYPMPAIAGLPYSFEQVTENVQTLADGTHISQSPNSTKMYRDAAGRTRTERNINMGYPLRTDGPTIVEIYDVVGGYRYVYDSVNKIAHRSPLPASPQGRGMVGGITGSTVIGGIAGAAGSVVSSTTTTMAAARPAPPKAADAPPRPETSSESLGTQVIEGLSCEGRRTTTTYPIGAMGNDRPLVSTNEYWTSTELKVMVLSKRKDPRMGDSTTTLKNISRADPEFNLFQPPADYKVVDETGSFELTIKY